MKTQVVGIYREAEFSPGKVNADRLIMDAVLAHLRDSGAETTALDAGAFVNSRLPSETDVILAMCQGSAALAALAVAEKSGAIVINSALAIRNCYRDLLGPGLIHAHVPTPEGAVVSTSEPIDLSPLRILDLHAPVYVKRGDLHALGEGDVQRVVGIGNIERTLHNFGDRGIKVAYVQQEVPGTVVKFYGVGNSEYFAAVPGDGGVAPPDALQFELARAASSAAAALGLEVWGGDAIVSESGFAIVDFNDWPSFERVRDIAATAISRRVVHRLEGAH
jgi:glutathione synthase/RimK-type ligase-like ATP-grasp enzyme